MADETISLDITIEADRANMTLGDLEEGFEAMNAELKETGRGTERFKELSTAMAQTSVEIQNVEASFEGLDSNAVAGEMGALAGGIGDVTASLVLMGGENETIEQIAASIETALAISMGFKGAIEGVSAASKIYTDLQNKGKIATIAKSIAEKAAAAGTWLLAGAQTALNAIMALNPIALVVLAVGGLIAGFVALGGSIMSLIKTALAPMQAVIDGIISTLRWLGIMQSESAVAAEEAADAIDQANVRQQQAYAETLRELKKLADFEKKRTDAVISDIDRELARRKASGLDTEDLERKRVLSIRDTTKAELEALKIRVVIAEQEFDIAYASGSISAAVSNQKLKEFKELKAASEALAIQLLDDTNDVYVFNRGIRKADEDEAKAASEAKSAQRIKDKEEWNKGADERAFKLRQEQQAKKDALMEDIDISTKKVELINTEIEGIKAMAMVELETAENLLAAKKVIASQNEKLAIEADERRQSGLDLAQAGLDVLSAGADAFIKDEVKREKIKKKLAIAQMAIDTARAISSVIAAAASTSITPVDLAIKIASGIAMVLANVAQAKALLGASGSTSAEGLGSSAGGAGGAGGGANIRPVSNTSTLIGDQNVTVVETDITNVQNKVKVIEESATF